MPPCTQRPCDVSIACVTLVETSIFCLYVLSPDVMPCLPTSISSATEYRKGTKRNLRNAYWLPNSILFCFFLHGSPQGKLACCTPFGTWGFRRLALHFACSCIDALWLPFSSDIWMLHTASTIKSHACAAELGAYEKYFFFLFFSFILTLQKEGVLHSHLICSIWLPQVNWSLSIKKDLLLAWKHLLR